ncbi:MAG: VWA domain-containing protein [bacterium]
MKKHLFVLMCLFTIPVFANGLAIYSTINGTCLRLMNSTVVVNVNNQVATIKTTQEFKNNLGFELPQLKYAFPLDERANATQLRWKLNGVWYQANISATPQDTSQLGPNTSAVIREYLGDKPLSFTIPNQIKRDSTIIVELTFVHLLDYEFGKVYFEYPNNYSKIQADALFNQELNFSLISDRTIDSIFCTSHTGTTITNNGSHANIYYHKVESPANKNYKINYSLSREELGLAGFSSFLPYTVVPDAYGSGFFTFVVEPDPSENTNIINKRFTLMIDRSGSMYDSTMAKAKQAAQFIVENLNAGDKFNLISFSDTISSFMPQHVEYNDENKMAALDYIQGLTAEGLTNISGAFETAIMQFENTGEDFANIIIFITDGEPSVGITNINQLNNYIQTLVEFSGSTICINNFGIGTSVNTQLLSLIASNNNGSIALLDTTSLLLKIKEFYLSIRNPVLLNPQITFEPDWIVQEVFPVAPPDLYRGKQLIISGRYNAATGINMKLSGIAFGSSVEYNYNFNLSSFNNLNYQFLPKVWAKVKMENLLIQYYNLGSTTEQAQDIYNQIVSISQMYGVLCDFTSFSGGYPTTGGIDDYPQDIIIAADFELLGNYPNPFNPSTTIRFKINSSIYQTAYIKIFNPIGQLICTLSVDIRGKGTYEVKWNGKDNQGRSVSSGVYLYSLNLGNAVMVKKMVLSK